jgi:hypothetical protein
VILEVFFDRQRSVHREFIPEEAIVNKRYKEALALIRLRLPEVWATGDRVLPHGIGQEHQLLLVKQQLAEHFTVMLPQSPYSPHCARCRFNLFPRMKDFLKGCHFKDAT